MQKVRRGRPRFDAYHINLSTFGGRRVNPITFALGMAAGGLMSNGGYVLSDEEIWDEFAYTEFDISPLNVDQVQPASVDLRLGSDFKVLKEKTKQEEAFDYGPRPIDTRKEIDLPMREFTGESITVEPGECVLGTTMEAVNMPPSLMAFCEGRSSVGRLFVEVHQTAGIIDPGYRGEITLEIKNNNPRPVKLYAGQRVCQLVIHKLNQPSKSPYGAKEDSKYQDQTGATPSRLNDDE